MSFAATVLLGAIAGFTIFLSLPLGRLQGVSERVRVFLTMTSAGILVFLLVDIFGHAVEPLGIALAATRDGKAPWPEFLVLAGTFAFGLTLGLVGLAIFESRVMHTGQAPGQPLTPTRMALIIAAGLGLHNFAEGLAIGQSSVQGHVALAGVLIVGFGLHNATEGFGIVGPLANTRPSWRFLLGAGLLAGGPTFLGTIVGYQFASALMSVLFLSLAGGSILFVVGELFNAGRRPGLKPVAMSGVAFGFLLGVATELLLGLAGG
jgi:ZIP family zinc transporter